MADACQLAENAKASDHSEDVPPVRVPVSVHRGASRLFTPNLQPSRIMAGYRFLLVVGVDGISRMMPFFLPASPLF